MPYLIVLALASAVGVAVYAITLRAGTHPASLDAGPAEAPIPAGPPTYLVDDGRPGWQVRLTGLLGLVVAVVVGGIALAAVLYISVSAAFRMFSG